MDGDTELLSPHPVSLSKRKWVGPLLLAQLGSLSPEGYVSISDKLPKPYKADSTKGKVSIPRRVCVDFRPTVE